MNAEDKEALTTFQQQASEMSPAERDKLMQTMLESITPVLIAHFLIMGMENGIESTVENPPTGDVFHFSFKRIRKIE